MFSIYIIQNKVNDKVYIGMTKGVSRRFSDHRRNLRNNNHVNKYLQSAWNSYGETLFDFYVVCECTHIEEAKNIETMYIGWFKDIGLCYNLTEGGECLPSRLGHKQTPELIKKRVEARRGYKHSEETKEKIRQGNLGKKWSEETRKNFKGRVITEEQKSKISNTLKGRYSGKNNPMYGKKHSEETKEKLSAARIGKVPWNKNKM